ncbi:hypothetical protein GCM10018773_61230 [Streptomyces candidus]|nr:hypothetical protein GCM10018773_61230 [Streptomyces candidus]
MSAKAAGGRSSPWVTGACLASQPSMRSQDSSTVNVIMPRTLGAGADTRMAGAFRSPRSPGPKVRQKPSHMVLNLPPKLLDRHVGP